MQSEGSSTDWKVCFPSASVGLTLFQAAGLASESSLQLDFSGSDSQLSLVHSVKWKCSEYGHVQGLPEANFFLIS